MEEQAIVTPILRLYVAYYRCLGLHLFELHWDRLSTSVLLNLAWNLALNGLVAYRMHYLDPFRLGHIVGMCDSFKPLFALFIRFGSNYAYPAVFILNMLYMVAGGRGPAIVRLLDSPCFRRGARSERTAKIIFVASLLLSHLLFFVFLLEKSRGHLRIGWPSGRQAIVYASVYVIFNYNYALFFTAHYYQHGIRTELTRLASLVRRPECSLAEETEVLDEIERIALVCRQFSRLFSLPVISFGLLHAFNCILLGSLLLSCTPCYGMLQHAFTVILYSLFLLRENAAILRLVDDISGWLRAKYYRLSSTDQLGRSRRRRSSVSDSMDSKLQSHWLRIADLDACYRDHFRLNIFRLGALDFAAYLGCVLFVFNFILIFTQTNL